MNEPRRAVYDAYVTQHIRAARDFSPEGYRRAALFCRYRYRRWLPADKKAAILELGCGHGSFLFWLQREGYVNLSGIDTSPEQVELARRILPNVQQADIFAFLESNRNGYDLIAALDVIEHFRKDEALRLARAVYEALRPTGRFLIQTVNGDSPFQGHQRYHDLTHETAYTPYSLETLVRVAGFDRVEFTELGPVPHGLVSGLRWVLWRLIAAGLAAYQLIETGTTGESIFTQNFAACAYKQ